MYSGTVTQFQDWPTKRDKSNGKVTTTTLTATVDSVPESISPPKQSIRQKWIWRNIIGIAVLHILAFYSLATRAQDATFWTWVFSTVYGHMAGLGITAGAHRLWAHRSYSAKLPLRIFLAHLYCMAGQTSPYKWVRDHRTHHRYTETSADPHDANRGFFFSHVGWLMMKRHPAVIEYGRKIDMSDMEADPVMRFTNKYFTPLMLFLAFILPTVVPVYVWGETWDISIRAVIIRYVWSLNATFLVNSFAHMWGNKPYNREVKPTENATVAFFTLGEGWHNYHHSFPWDYKAAELGAYGLNPTTAFIEAMAKLGLAYDLKRPSDDLIAKVSLKKGDGTNSRWGKAHHPTGN